MTNPYYQTVHLRRCSVCGELESDQKSKHIPLSAATFELWCQRCAAHRGVEDFMTHEERRIQIGELRVVGTEIKIERFESIANNYGIPSMLYFKAMAEKEKNEDAVKEAERILFSEEKSSYVSSSLIDERLYIEAIKTAFWPPTATCMATAEMLRYTVGRDDELKNDDYIREIIDSELSLRDQTLEEFGEQLFEPDWFRILSKSCKTGYPCRYPGAYSSALCNHGKDGKLIMLARNEIAPTCEVCNENVTWYRLTLPNPSVINVYDKKIVETCR